jgi:hypothetical protein
VGILVSENGNEKSSVHMTLAVEAEEIYEFMSRILDAIRCKENNWQFCADMKINAFGWTTEWIYQVWLFPHLMANSNNRTTLYAVKNLTAKESSFLG